LAACSDSSPPPDPPAAVAQPQSVAAKPEPTKSDWSKKFRSSYVETNKKDAADGTADFTACFNQTTQCELFAFGQRDAFRDLTTFEPAGSRLNRNGNPKYVHSYVSVIDCQAPSILLEAKFFSKGSWIFLKQLAVMVDGDVLLKHDISFDSVKRDSDSYGIT